MILDNNQLAALLLSNLAFMWDMPRAVRLIYGIFWLVVYILNIYTKV